MLCHLKKHSIAVFAIFTGCLYTSCSSSKKIQTVDLDPVTVSVNKAAMEMYRASATREWDIKHTTASLSFNYKEKTADGKAWIDIKPYFYPADSLVLDAKGMRIERVALMPDTMRNLSYTYQDDQLKIKFAHAYTRNDSITLYIRYTAMPYGAPSGGSEAITDDRGLYFINTDFSIPGKPAQIWTQGETESNSHWLPTIDKPNERFTIRLLLNVPDSFVSLGNGYLSAQIAAGNHIRTDMWVMDKPIQPYAIMFAIGNFAVVEDQWRGREVNYYVEPQYEPYARRMFQHTPEMMEFFSRITGVRYPWNKYSQVVVRDYVSGAMENTSASLFGEFMNQNFREMADRDYEDVVSHELFHQWFGDYVTAESWSNLTLNESFANYSEQLWRRYKYGKASADELAYDDLRTYLSQAKSNDPSLVRYHYESREDMFDRVSYQKGGAILNYLQGLMGDDAFYKAMNLYLTRNALQPAEAAQWRIAVEDATGQDWNWFFDQWYYRGGHPVLDVQYNYDDAAQQLNVTVSQKQNDLYQLPLKALIAYNANDNTIHDWNISKPKQTFTYAYKNGQRPVVVPDAMHWLVGELKENKQPAQWRDQYRYSNDFLSKYIALANITRKTDDTIVQNMIALALNDTIPALREGALEVLQLVKKDNLKQKWQQLVAYMAQNDANNKVRAAAIDLLSKWKADNMQSLYASAISDSSYIVAGTALLVLKDIAKDTAYALGKQMLETDPQSTLRYAAWQTIAEQGRAEDVSIFINAAYHVYGTQKIQFASTLAEYLETVKDTAAFGKGLSAFRYLISSENIKSYRWAIASWLLNVAQDYKEQAADASGNKEKDMAKQRMEKVRQVAEELLKAETEEENRGKYENYLKRIYGNTAK